VTEFVWLGLALVGGAAAYLVGWPAWESYRSREERDRNADRYLAWRGRARSGSSPASEGMTREERRRIYVGTGLAIAAALSLFTFFSST
jgi:hypothetical protein